MGQEPRAESAASMVSEAGRRQPDLSRTATGTDTLTALHGSWTIVRHVRTCVRHNTHFPRCDRPCVFQDRPDSSYISADTSTLMETLYFWKQ